MRWSLLLLAAACSQRRVAPADTRSPLEVQAERAAAPGPEQALEQVRLASLAMAAGDVSLAEGALRQAVGRMQDFRAEGELRAVLGAESAKEWKGDPYEKMMAFFLLGNLLYASGDPGNALAMTKSALLADTGTSALPYRADFVPAYVLQALAYLEVGERNNAERSIDQAIDALYLRVATGRLAERLDSVELDDADAGAEAAARVLLLSGLPSGLMAHPRDMDAAIRGALSRATELRAVALDGRRGGRPAELSGLRRRDLTDAHDVLEPLTAAWRAAAAADSAQLAEQLAGDEQMLRSLLDGPPPRLVLWVETGRGPEKIATGRYGEVQQLVETEPGHTPDVRIDGRPLAAHPIDSVTWQAQTRGARRVDGFLRGKAVFKDAAPLLGYAALVAGDIARMSQDSGDSGAVGTALYLVGAATWVAGAVTNPRADTRAWDLLPDQLHLVVADPTPGRHTLTIDDRSITLDIPDRGTVLHVVPALAPHGADTIGSPCVACAPPAPPAPDRPLAVPASTPTPGGAP